MAVFEEILTDLVTIETGLSPEAAPFSAASGSVGGLSWYCVRTKPKHEHIVAAGFQRNLNLEVFHPRLRVERSTRRGVVRVVESLFPCYVFVRCDISESLHPVRYINGVSGLVHFGQRIPVVPDDVVDELRQCFETQELMDVEDQILPGTEVTVGEGAFRGINGIVLKVLPAKQRVQILLDFLGRTTLAEVDRKSLVVENRSLADMMPKLAAVGSF